PRWLRDAGIGDVHEESEDSGFLYCTQFFRTRDGSVPAVRTPFQSTPIGSFTILTVPSDRRTWSVNRRRVGVHESVARTRARARPRPRGAPARHRPRAHLDDPRELAEAWDAVTETEFTPWYRATVATDRARLAEIDRLRSNGARLPPPADPATRARARLAVAATRDPDLFRAVSRGCRLPDAPRRRPRPSRPGRPRARAYRRR